MSRPRVLLGDILDAIEAKGVEGATIPELAKFFGCSPSTIRKLIRKAPRMPKVRPDHEWNLGWRYFISDKVALKSPRYSYHFPKPKSTTDFLVQVRLPEGVTAKEYKAYIESALQYWGGPFSPEDPLFSPPKAKVTIQ